MSFSQKEVPVSKRRLSIDFVTADKDGAAVGSGVRLTGQFSQNAGVVWHSVGRFGEKWNVIAFDDCGNPVSPGQAPHTQEEACEWLFNYHNDQRRFRQQRRAALRSAKAGEVK